MYISNLRKILYQKKTFFVLEIYNNFLPSF